MTYDPAKRQRTLEERGLDFDDAVVVFEGRTVEVAISAKTTESVASSVMGGSPGVSLSLGTLRVARPATFSA